MEAKVEQPSATNANPVLSVNKDGSVFYSNEAGNLLLKEWGVKVGEKLPSNIGDLVQIVISKNSPEKIEVKIGNRIHLVVFSPLPEQEVVIISGFDISEQKEIEEHLLEAYEQIQTQSEELSVSKRDLRVQSDELNEANTLFYDSVIGFRTLAETSSDFITRFDRQDHCIYANPAAKLFDIPLVAEFYGWSVHEFIDKTNPKVEINPEMMKLSEKLRKNAFNTGKSEAMVLHYTSPKGKKYWFDTKVIPEFANNEVVSILVISSDITDLKVAEATLRSSNLYNRSLIEASLDPLVVIGNDGNVKDVNKATEQATGYSRNDLIGTYFAQYLTEPDHAISAFINVCTHGELRDCALEIKHRDGHITPVLCNASVYRDENGKVIGVFVAARDITERKKAEKALRKARDSLEERVKERTEELEKAYISLKESEKSLTEAQEMANIGNWVWDIKADKAYWSEELYRIFGCSPQESAPTYNEYLNNVHPDDLIYVADAFQKAAVDGKSYSIDHRIVLASGEERTVHIKSEVIFDEKNTPVRVKGIVQDITERKKAEEKIERLANIIEYTNDGIGLITPEGIVLEWNKGEEHIYGYDVEDIVGRHISVLTPPHLKNEPMDHAELVKQTRTSYNYTASRLRKDGKTIEVSITLAPVFDSHGKLTAISFITRDITEQKRAEEKLLESEEKYRNIVETANEGIALINNEGVIKFVNKKMADMLEYSVEEIVDRTVWDFVEEEQKASVTTKFDGRRKGSNYDTFEFKLRRKDGSSLWVLISAKALFEKDGKFIGTLNLHTDITKRKEAEEALANLETARKKEIHHRIKNNLQVISSLLDLQSEQFRNLECIKNSEVLDAFRESQGRVTSMALIHEELYKGGEFETLNFSSYIEELAESLLQTYRLGNTCINLNTDLEKNLFFDMDIAVPLGIIVNELVSNSLKHAFPNRDNGKIQIKLHRQKNGESKSEDCNLAYILTVSDNGIGIPEDLDIEDLDSLGLQLVTTLVDQLDGELEMKRNNGTEFIIKFTVTEKNNLEFEKPII